MVKILAADQVREADQQTILKEPISSLDLMERAAANAFQWIQTNWSLQKGEIVHVFCGPGNNGGDGLVLARLLHEQKIPVKVYLVNPSNALSEDCQKNLKRLPCNYQEIEKEKTQLDLSSGKIIDALFGSGLSRPLTGVFASLINQINQSALPVLSIDIPSGLFMDASSVANDKAIIRSSNTLSFQFPKLAFLMPENEDFVGDWALVPIGLNPDYIKNVTCKNFYLQDIDIKSILKTRKSFSHKGTFGHAFIVAGSKGKIGAAILSSKSAMRTGLGLLTVQVPGLGYEIMQTSIPEAMVLADENQEYNSQFLIEPKYNVIGLGPGMGTNEETQHLVKRVIQENRIPLVIDADALNCLALNKTWLSFLPSNSILTPHPGEFKRLVGEWSDDFDRLEKLKSFSFKYGVYTVLKGKNTSIACPDGKLFFNSTGNAGMATAGTGDVLTGMITSFIAQGYAPEEAAILGVYIHGMAGDLAAKKVGEASLMAGDLIEYIPSALKEFQLK